MPPAGRLAGRKGCWWASPPGQPCGRPSRWPSGRRTRGRRSWSFSPTRETGTSLPPCSRRPNPFQTCRGAGVPSSTPAPLLQFSIVMTPTGHASAAWRAWSSWPAGTWPTDSATPSPLRWKRSGYSSAHRPQLMQPSLTVTFTGNPPSRRRSALRHSVPGRGWNHTSWVKRRGDPAPPASPAGPGSPGGGRRRWPQSRRCTRGRQCPGGGR